MAEDFEHNIRITGMNQLGVYQKLLLSVSNGTATLKRQNLSLNQVLGSSKEIQSGLNAIMQGSAKTMKHLMNNQKAMKGLRKVEINDLRASRDALKKNSKEWRVLNKEIAVARVKMASLPLRKLGTDLRSVSLRAQDTAKNLQWVGRQMMVGFGLPVIMGMRRAIQTFYSFEKALVRTSKILGKTGDEMDRVRENTRRVSEELGVSRTIVAGLTADFAQMGAALMGSNDGINNIEQMAGEYAELTLQLEKVGQVQASVGRDFIANIAGLTKAMDPAGDRIDKVRGLLAKLNMMENTTALSMADLAEAFPQVSPAAVAAGIELVFLTGLLARMKEMGLNATESAHALKFSIQRLVNPTTKSAKAAEKFSNMIGPEFHSNLGIGNMMMFRLAENMKLIAEHASDKDALVYLGELVGKRQASRLFALVMGMESLEDSIKGVGTAFQAMSFGGKGAFADFGKELADNEYIYGFQNDIKNAFKDQDSIDAFRADIIKADQAMGKFGQGLHENSSDAAVWTTAFSKLSPEMKALAIDAMGATEAGKIFAQELEIVLAGPAAMMDKVKSQFRNLMEEFGAQFYEAIQGLIPSIQRFVASLQNMDTGTKRMIIVIVGAVAALGPLLFMLAQMGIVVATVARAMAFFVPQMKMMSSAMMVSTVLRGKMLGPMRKVGGMLIKEGGLVSNLATKYKILSGTQGNIFKKMKAFSEVGQKQASGLLEASKSPKKSTSVFRGGAAANVVTNAQGVMVEEMAPGMHGPAKPVMHGPPAPPKPKIGPFRAAAAKINKVFHISAMKRFVVEQIAATKSGAAWLTKVGAASKFIKKWFTISSLKRMLVERFSASMSGRFWLRSMSFANNAIRKSYVATAFIIGTAFKVAGKIAKKAFMFGGITSILFIIIGLVLVIKDNLGQFGEAVKPGVEIIKRVFSKIMAFFKRIGTMVMEIFGSVFGKEGGDGSKDSGINAVGEIFEKVASAVEGFLDVVMNVVLKVLPPILKGFMKMWKFVFGIIGKVVGFVQEHFQTFAGVIQSVVYWITAIFEGFVDVHLWIAEQIVMIVGHYIPNAFVWLGRLIMQAVVLMVRVLGEWYKFVIDLAFKVIDAFITMGQGIAKGAEVVAETVGGLLEAVGLIDEKPDFDWTSWGDDVKGTLNGAKDAATGFIDGFVEMVENYGAGADDMSVSTAGWVKSITDVLSGIRDFDLARTVSEGVGSLLGNIGGTDLIDSVADAVGEGGEEGVDEFTDLNETQKSELADDIKDAVGKGFQQAVNEFVDKVKAALKEELARIADAAMAAFDAYTEVALSAYDARIEAIEEVKKAEEELTKTLQYESKRREIVNQMALDKENFIRNRQLAIYEGRVEDARNLSVQYIINEEKSAENLTKLDDKRENYLVNKERDMAIAAINVAKDLEAERLKIIREGLQEQVEILKEQLPATVEEWQTWMDTLSQITDTTFQSAFGENGVLDSSLDGVSASIQTSVDTWTNILENFDPNTAFQNIFDKVNETWKSALEWDIIALEWMDSYMALSIPILQAKLAEIKGELESGMGDAIVDPIIDAFADIIDGVNDASDVKNLKFSASGGSGALHYQSSAGPGGSLIEAYTIATPFAGVEEHSATWTPPFVLDSDMPDYGRRNIPDRFFGGAIRAQYGRYLGGFRSAAVPVIAHGGEYVMNARAVQSIGLSNLEAMNRTGKSYGGGGATGVTINVDNFIGQPEWFEEMMKEYDVKVTPKADRNAGTDVRKISSMADTSSRRRV